MSLIPTSPGNKSPLAITLLILLTSGVFAEGNPVPLQTQERTTIVVKSANALNRAVANADPGDEIIIAAGLHSDWKITLAGKGAPDKPVVIRPQISGETVMTGATALKLTGSYIEIHDLLFRDCSMDEANIITIEDASHCRITRCRFENSEGTRRVFDFRGKASSNRIDHCTLIHTVGRPITITINERHLPVNNRIDHNLFEDVPFKGSNGRETIQIGQNQPVFGMLEPKTIVEFNVFYRCNGEGEIISNKSSSNIYRGNIFRECRGALVMRGGSKCVIEDNWFEQCISGIRLHGTHHIVKGNTIINPEGAGIILPYGMQRSLGSLYQATGFCLVEHNTVVNPGENGIFLGANRNVDRKHDDWNYEKHGDVTILGVAPYQNRILNNILAGSRGILMYVDGSPDNEISGNLIHAMEAADPGKVGEAAILADPLFTKPASNNFQLQPGSPAYKNNTQLGSSGQRPEAGPDY